MQSSGETWEPSASETVNKVLAGTKNATLAFCAGCYCIPLHAIKARKTLCRGTANCPSKDLAVHDEGVLGGSLFASLILIASEPDVLLVSVRSAVREQRHCYKGCTVRRGNKGCSVRL